MRILRLDLLAFGHFTGVELDLSRGGEAVQLIYGANEAGKSTALRALRALFYGIDTRSPDNFLHEHRLLRIGGIVRRSDGTEIDFVRRKGAKETFLGRDGNALDETPLRSALSAVDAELFTSLFGINHGQLVAGGEGILQGGGDVGESLFAAGFGGGSLRVVLEKLDAEAADLFKPLGQNQAINRACREYKEANDKISGNALAGREYEERAAALEVAKTEREAMTGELRTLRRETNRLERAARALPLLLPRRTLREELAQLGAVPSLPEGFSERRISALAMLASAQARSKTEEGKIADLDRQIAALPVSEALLARAEVIAELYQRLGSHRKAARDLPGVRAELRTLEKEAARLLADLKLDTPESASLSRASQRKAQALANRHQALAEKLETATRVALSLRRDLESKQEECRTLPDVTALRQAAGEAQRHGDLEEDLANRSEALRAAEASAAEALKRLKPWKGTLEELTAFAAPGVETLDRFEKSLLATENAALQTALRIKEVKARATQCERELEVLLRSGSVPTEADLTAARARREQGWKVIRGRWVQPPVDSTEAATLAESYEADVQAADEIADRLRREAARVAQHAGLAAERDQLAREVEALEAESTQQAAAMAQLNEDWRAPWAPLDPLPPREMRAWLQKQERLLGLATDSRERREAVAAVEKRLAEHRAALIGHLPAGGDLPLRALISQSLRLVERTDLVSRDLLRLTEDLKTATVERDEAEASLAKWRSEWRDAMHEIGRPETAAPDAANEFIADCAELQKKQAETDRLRVRIKAIQTEAEAFEKEAAAAFEPFHPGVPAPGGEDAVTGLQVRLNEASRNAATLAALKKQRTESATGLEEALGIIAAEESRLGEMCRLAGCAEAAELEAVERKAREAQSRRMKLEQLEDRLAAESAGVSLDDFMAEVEALDADQVQAGIAENQRIIGEREERHTQLATQIGGLETQLAAMDGNARAGEAAEEAQSVLARIEEHAERYIRVKLAAAILRREIEDYRAKNQNPLLARAGELFRQLTLGSFTSIATGFAENDQPILEGVRASGGRVGVGGMSDGTRDQLYLALQLASVEKFIGTCEPMPFIVDDILIAFDQEREAAVLKVLAELAAKTQVIIFTHHRHLVELAQRTLGGAVQVHELGAQGLPR